MIDLFPYKRMYRLIGHNIDIASQIFAQIKHQSTAIKQRRPLAKRHQEIDIARGALFAAYHGTKHADVVSAPSVGESQNLPPMFFEELQAGHDCSVPDHETRRTGMSLMEKWLP